MKILFSSNHWDRFKIPMLKALLDANISAESIIPNTGYLADEIEFIIYSPDSKLKDFSPFVNLKAVLNLWAGVENIVENPTLKAPLYRLVDHKMSQGMLEWCTAHALRHHLSTDRYVLNQDGLWRDDFLPPLANERNIGVLGLGALGSATANSLQSLGFQVAGWTRTRNLLQKNILSFYGKSGLKKILTRSEIIILLLPLTPVTKNLICQETIKLMPKGATIINAGRGGLVNDLDLINALESGQLSHATLDVFETEPLPPDHLYWKQKNVTVSPHVAAATRPESASKVIIGNIVKLENGLEPEGLVNRTVSY